MRILILGAGRVGESVAETLVSEANDITLIDTDPALLRKLEERLELRGVAGNGTLPSVLRGAGADDCDLFIAATGQDATNLVACKVAHDVFGVPSTIARLRSSEYRDGELLGKGDRETVAELHARLAPPLLALAFALLTLPLARSSPRQQRYGRLMLGFLAYLVSVNLVFIGTRMLAEGELPPILGLWWLTLPLLALAVWLYLRDGRLPRARRLAA